MQHKYGGDRPTPFFRPLPGLFSQRLLSKHYKLQEYILQTKTIITKVRFAGVEEN